MLCVKFRVVNGNVKDKFIKWEESFYKGIRKVLWRNRFLNWWVWVFEIEKKWEFVLRKKSNVYIG